MFFRLLLGKEGRDEQVRLVHRRSGPRCFWTGVRRQWRSPLHQRLRVRRHRTRYVYQLAQLSLIFVFKKIYSVHVIYTILNWTWWCFVNRCLLLDGQFKSTKSGWQRYSLSGRLSGKVSHCVVQCHCALTPSFQVFYSQHTCCITPACLHHFSSSYTAVLYATSSQCQYAKKHGHSTSTRIHWWTWMRWTHNGIQHFLAWKMTRSSMQLLYWHRRISPDLCCYCCFEFIVTIVTSETLTTLMKWDL